MPKITHFVTDRGKSIPLQPDEFIIIAKKSSQDSNFIDGRQRYTQSKSWIQILLDSFTIENFCIGCFLFFVVLLLIFTSYVLLRLILTL